MSTKEAAIADLMKSVRFQTSPLLDKDAFKTFVLDLIEKKMLTDDEFRNNVRVRCDVFTFLLGSLFDVVFSFLIDCLLHAPDLY